MIDRGANQRKNSTKKGERKRVERGNAHQGRERSEIHFRGDSSGRLTELRKLRLLLSEYEKGGGGGGGGLLINHKLHETRLVEELFFFFSFSFSTALYSTRRARLKVQGNPG